MNKELKISYDILKKVVIGKSYVSIELNRVLNNVDDVNTSLITKIVYGVLEKDIALEYFVSCHVSKLPKTNILIILKMISYISHNINSIPHFALVNEMVNISKKEDSHISGFVNAVSKKLISNNLILPSKKNLTKHLSIKYNYPEWVITELLKSHDVDFVTSLISKELTTLTHVRVNLDMITAREFKSKLNEEDITFEDSLFDYTLYVDYAKLLKSKLKDYAVVQGLPSIITCNSLQTNKGKVLDVCSAPGGKAMYLSHNKNLEIYACDIYPHRVELIKKYAQKLKAKNVKTFVQDGTKINNDWIENFDYVMCDVPCSNLGVSRKKPDVFLNKSIEDVDGLTKLQYEILSTSAKYVKKGGILQYSTCTIIDSENKCVIEKFLENNKDFELTEIETNGLNITNDNKKYTFYPHLTNTEGFFIGRLIRK